jgi:twitching motility two-component system response regulator PilH
MKRILIIDDDVIFRHIAAHCLEKNGFSVICSGDGSDCLAMIVQHQPHLLVLDVNLPHASGFDILRRIREHPAAGSLPVIMVSALGQELNRERGVTSGCNRYLVKPVDPDEFIQTVTELLDTSEG